MSRNRNALVSHQAAIAPRTVAKWVASAEEVSQYLPSLTKGQQACVLAHAQYQKIPDVVKETGYGVHTNLPLARPARRDAASARRSVTPLSLRR